VAPRRTSTPKHPPNRQLTWARLQRGWSREELVEQIKRSFATEGEQDTGLTVETARRWETGDRKPELRYKKHLVLVFDTPASQLGLLSAEELALGRSCRSGGVLANSSTNGSFVDLIVRRVVGALLGADGEFGRDLFLKGLLGASLAPLIFGGLTPPVDAEAIGSDRRTRLDPRAVEAYMEITAAHRDLYSTSSASDLLPSVIAHVRMGYGLLKSASNSSGQLAQRLAGAVTESALLGARLSFFDLADVYTAMPLFQLADDAVETSGDHALAAAVAAHRAFVPGFAGKEQPARRYLATARTHARYAGGPRLRSWLHCVDAEITARLGHQKESLARISSAEEALVVEGADPDWLNFFDASRLASFAGNALLLAGQHKSAVPRLQQALAGLDPTPTKQQAVVLFDLATAQAATDAELALHTASRACDVLDGAYYATAMNRLPDVRTALGPTPYASALDERVRSLTGAPEES
jgi:transcriptional regulator with XRE-family HTH domain